MKIRFASALVVVAVLSASSVRAADTCPAAGKDIVDTAVAAGSFKTLAAALGAGGLVETLKSKDPFTVFAPTDDAFAKLPKGTVENLLRPENKAKLVRILSYHVVAGKVMATGHTAALPPVNATRANGGTRGSTCRLAAQRLATATHRDRLARHWLFPRLGHGFFGTWKIRSPDDSLPSRHRDSIHEQCDYQKQSGQYRGT